MVTFGILLAVIVIGIYMAKSYYDDKEFIGTIMIMFGGAFMVMHLVLWLTASYNHQIFVLERNSFEETLNEARNNGKEYEAVAIVKEVAEWNKKLATTKYDNNPILLNPYIDDRIESLQPIK